MECEINLKFKRNNVASFKFALRQATVLAHMRPTTPPSPLSAAPSPPQKGKEIAFKIAFYKLGGDSFPRRPFSGKYIVLTFVFHLIASGQSVSLDYVYMQDDREEKTKQNKPPSSVENHFFHKIKSFLVT